MILIHKGVRPKGEIRALDFENLLFEDSDGGIWNQKMLNSGCGKKSKIFKELYGCYYCIHCDEYFSKDQWSEE
jgi:hypothetical protein